jgi:hypothetical protein
MQAEQRRHRSKIEGDCDHNLSTGLQLPVKENIPILSGASKCNGKRGNVGATIGRSTGN